MGFSYQSLINSGTWIVDVLKWNAHDRNEQTKVRPGLQDIGLFSCRIAFLNPLKKMLRSVRDYTKPGRQLSTRIISLSPYISCFLSPAVKQSISLICIEAILLSKQDLGAFSCRITMFNKTLRVLPDSFSYHLLMRSRIVLDCWSRASDSCRAV